MSLEKTLVLRDQHMVAAIYGTSFDGFTPNQPIILFSKETRMACLRFIRQVFDQGKNCFKVDLK
jgi:hypothetical protein